MTDLELRDKALAYAISAGGTTAAIVKAATDFYAFLSTGNASPSTSKPSATDGAKASKDVAPAADTPAPTPSSDKPATPSDAPKSEEQQPQTSSAATSPSEPVTRTDVMKVMGQFIKLKGEPAALEVLGKFGAAKLSGVPEDKYGELVAAFEAEV